MSSNFLKDASFDFKCPCCNGNIKVKVSSIGSIINCPYCNQSIELQDDSFTSGLNDANRMLDKFGKDLKNMFK